MLKAPLGWGVRVTLALMCVYTSFLNASTPEAVLRIETGGHTAAIRAIDADASGAYVLTASEDKTARVWDTQDGRLLRILRPPIGLDNDGKLFAAAISPDARVVAVAGWSSENSVYVFSRSTGAMIHRITGLANVVTALRFSPDGTQLAVGLWGSNGLRIYASRSAWISSTEIAHDNLYAAELNSVAFAPDGGAFVTSSSDGKLRRYATLPTPDATRSTLIRPLTVAQTVGGSQAFHLAFAPDSRTLALGFGDVTQVQLLDANSLAVVARPPVPGSGSGRLSAVAWSSDGRQLFAAGTWRGDGTHNSIRAWSITSQRSVAQAWDSSVARDTVTGLTRLADGRIAYAAADTNWGVLDAVGNTAKSFQRVTTMTDARIDWRGQRDAFRLSADGTGISLRPNQSKDAIAFDLTKSEWTQPSASWNAPIDRNTVSRVDEWLESATPRINGTAIPLSENEVAMTTALVQSGIAIGSNYFTRFYERSGTLRWRVPTAGTVWHVNVSADGRWVVVALADGTLRWLRARDGAEQLALLLHSDRRRWVAWTPLGYYAASAGGEDLVGWHYGRGDSQSADFFPASRFREKYFRPDVIAQVLIASDVATALVAANASAARTQTVTAPTVTSTANPATPTLASLAQPPAAQSLPPVITIESPREGDKLASAPVTLRVSIRVPVGAPLTGIRARVNGEIVALDQMSAAIRSVRSSDTEIKLEQLVTLGSTSAELMLFAENKNGFSTPAVVHLKAESVPPPLPPGIASPAQSIKPPALVAAVVAPKDVPSKTVSQVASVQAALNTNDADLRPALYLLAVGVSEYAKTDIRLDFAAKDAADFSKVFQLQERQLYRKVEVKLLTDANAKRDGVLDGLEWIRRAMTSRDVGVVFLAGHGVNDNDGVYYYLSQDSDPQSLKRTAVIFTEIRNTLAALPGKALFFVDTCHAGNVLGTGRRSIRTDITKVVNELSSAENGVIVFAASTGRQLAQESVEWGNGAFTRAVIEGMSGMADSNRSGRVTHKMLDLYVSERVKALTKGAQSPVTIVPQGIPDFPVAVTK